jgi:hypothetical protein
MGGRLAADVDITALRVSDTAPEARFNPIAMTGRRSSPATSGPPTLAFAPAERPARRRRAAAHEVLTGKGGVDIDTGRLVFAEGGLQPEQLSPLRRRWDRPRPARRGLSGGVAWTLGGQLQRRGKLAIQRMDFKSPAGRVTGLSGAIALDSLAR